MSELQILSQFKNSLISFFDELIELFPEESDLIMIRIFLKDQIPIMEVMNILNFNINKNDAKLKIQMEQHNEQFFLENNFLDGIDKNKVLHFKKLWKSPRLDSEDKAMIWKWIDSFLIMINKYNKLKQ
jgi:hypothetical protein